MENNDQKLASKVVAQLKKLRLIPADEIQIEKRIAEGTIKENDWKLYLETQIRNLEKKSKSETK